MSCSEQYHRGRKGQKSKAKKFTVEVPTSEDSGLSSKQQKKKAKQVQFFLSIFCPTSVAGSFSGDIEDSKTKI